MARARRAGSTALIVVVLTAGRGGWGRSPASAPAPSPGRPSTLVVSEVQTGGASASDEFVEIANQGAGRGRPARARGRLRDVVGLDRDAQGDLGDVARARARASGSCSRTPRASSPRSPTRRIRAASRRPVARSRCGSWAGRSSMRWAGATRRTRSSRGRRRAAPPAGSSLERSPGGALGNGTDTNDNAPRLVRPGARRRRRVSARCRPGARRVAESPTPDSDPAPRSRRRPPTRHADRRADTDSNAVAADAQPDADADADTATDADTGSRLRPDADADADADTGADRDADADVRHRHRARRDTDSDAEAHAGPRSRLRRRRRSLRRTSPTVRSSSTTGL